MLSRNFIILALFVLLAQTAFSQSETKSSYVVGLNQDAFFGFYPTIAGNVGLNDKVDWTFYGILWTTPSFGTGGGGGLWTEFGTGVNFKTLDGALSINPQVGFTNGKLLSNGAFPVFLEGIVPSLTANLNTSKFEGQFYLGLYTALRKGQIINPARPDALTDAPVQNNFLHWWVNAGYKISPVLSIGGLYEHLRSNPSSGESANLYKWFGPYVQAAIPNGPTLRISGGPNVMDRPATDGNNSFYKLTASFGF